MSQIKHFIFIISTILVFSCTATTNKQEAELFVINSTHLACDDSILVFTPSNITPQSPTLFLLHGWSGCYTDWSKKYDLQEISNRSGFRIICPDGFYNSWYVNDNDTTKMQWRTFFDEELYPQMKEKFELDPQRTFITGLSMGGQGSLNIFMDDPSRFRSAASMSGVLDLCDPVFRISHIEKVLGPRNDTNPRYKEESAIGRLEEYKEKIGDNSDKIIIVSCGYEDIYNDSAERFAKKCQALEINHIATFSKAKHSWDYWGYALEQHLWFFTKILNGENLGY